MIRNDDDLMGILKEEVMTFQVLSKHLPGGRGGNPGQVSWYPD